MAGVPQSREDNWISQNFNTYFVLQPGVDPHQMEVAFNSRLSQSAVLQLQDLLHLGCCLF